MIPGVNGQQSERASREHECGSERRGHLSEPDEEAGGYAECEIRGWTKKHGRAHPGNAMDDRRCGLAGQDVTLPRRSSSSGRKGARRLPQPVGDLQAGCRSRTSAAVERRGRPWEVPARPPPRPGRAATLGHRRDGSRSPRRTHRGRGPGPIWDHAASVAAPPPHRRARLLAARIRPPVREENL